MREGRHLNNAIKHKIALSSQLDPAAPQLGGRYWDYVRICQI